MICNELVRRAPLIRCIPLINEHYSRPNTQLGQRVPSLLPTRRSGEGRVCLSQIFRKKGQQFNQALRNIFLRRFSLWYSLGLCSWFQMQKPENSTHTELGEWSSQSRLSLSGSFRPAAPFLSDSLSCALLPGLASPLGWYFHGLCTSHVRGLRSWLSFLQSLMGNIEACANWTRTALLLVCTGTAVPVVTIVEHFHVFGRKNFPLPFKSLLAGLRNKLTWDRLTVEKQTKVQWHVYLLYTWEAQENWVTAKCVKAKEDVRGQGVRYERLPTNNNNEQEQGCYANLSPCLLHW